MHKILKNIIFICLPFKDFNEICSYEALILYKLRKHDPLNTCKYHKMKFNPCFIQKEDLIFCFLLKVQIAAYPKQIEQIIIHQVKIFAYQSAIFTLNDRMECGITNAGTGIIMFQGLISAQKNYKNVQKNR